MVLIVLPRKKRLLTIGLRPESVCLDVVLVAVAVSVVLATAVLARVAPHHPSLLRGHRASLDQPALPYPPDTLAQRRHREVTYQNTYLFA